MKSNCTYCNYLSIDTLNGLDRLDSNKSYELTNVVSCCKLCNFMKGSLDANTFIKRCKHISYVHGGVGEINENIWKNSKSVSYKSYESRAIKKNLEFALTKDQFIELINNDCYYCKRKTNENNINGVDRKDNIFENCISCCSECNQMKNILSDIDFINKCKDVSNYCIDNNVVFENVNECLKKITKRIRYDIKKEKIIIKSYQEKETKEHSKPYILIKNNLQENTEETKVCTRKKLPVISTIKLEDIPKYCYYVKATRNKGDGFCCDKTHPKHKDKNTKKIWISKKLSLEEKFKLMIEYINE